MTTSPTFRLGIQSAGDTGEDDHARPRRDDERGRQHRGGYLADAGLREHNLVAIEPCRCQLPRLGASCTGSWSMVASRSSASSWGSAEMSAIGPRSSLTVRPYRYASGRERADTRPARPPPVFEQLVETGSPSVVEELMVEFGLSRAETTARARELADARHIALVSGTSRILMAFPFSAIATPFRVTANGRSYFANCCLGRVAFHSMLDEPITIDSFCQHCARADSHRAERRPRHSRRAGRGDRLPCARADAMVGGHHHDLLQHDGLLLRRPSIETRPTWPPTHNRIQPLRSRRTRSTPWA